MEHGKYKRSIRRPRAASPTSEAAGFAPRPQQPRPPVPEAQGDSPRRGARARRTARGAGRQPTPAAEHARAPHGRTHAARPHARRTAACRRSWRAQEPLEPPPTAACPAGGGRPLQRCGRPAAGDQRRRRRRSRSTLYRFRRRPRRRGSNRQAWRRCGGGA